MSVRADARAVLRLPLSLVTGVWRPADHEIGPSRASRCASGAHYFGNTQPILFFAYVEKLRMTQFTDLKYNKLILRNPEPSVLKWP